MRTKLSLTALAIALPLTMAAAAPALADQDRHRPGSYDIDYGDRDYNDRDSYRENDQNGYWGRGQVLSPLQIEFRLERRGYRNVRNVTYSRAQGHYHAEARDYRGNAVRLSIDPRTAQVIDSEYATYGNRLMPFWRVERRLEARGYFAVQQLGAWQGRYRVEARDGRGRYVRLIVDAYTGEILRQQAADYGRRWSSREYDWN